MQECDSLLVILEKIRRNRNSAPIPKVSRLLVEQGYKPTIYLIGNKAVGVYPGQPIPGTNITPIPKKE